MNKIFHLYILSLFFCSAGVFAFADQPGSSLDDKSSLDTTTNSDYDLDKLVEKSRENIKEVNEKIEEQAVLKRNQKRAERAHEYYEKGVELTNEGKLNEAREYFEKAIRVTEHPEMAGYIKESPQQLKKQESSLQDQIKQDENVRKEAIEAAYKEAVDLYDQKKYHPAKDAFERVDAIAPEYRATDSYLKMLDQDIIVSDAQAAKQQVVEVADQQIKEKERKEATDKQAQEVYDQGVGLYKNKKFAEAKKKFEEVNWVIPDYKDVRKYLARIDRDAQEEQARMAQEQRKAQEENLRQQKLAEERLRAQELKDKTDKTEKIYDQALDAYRAHRWEEARAQFQSVEQMIPGFKHTGRYLKKIVIYISRETPAKPASVQTASPPQASVEVVPPSVVPSVPVAVVTTSDAENFHQQELALEHQRVQELKERSDQAEKIYSQALKAYRAHQWEEARSQFETVEQMIPNYKHTHRYLQKVDDFISRESVAPIPSPVAASEPPAPATVTTPVEPSPAPPAPVEEVAAPVLPAVPPVQVKAAVSLEDQQKQTQDIAALAEKSAQLYRQIADVADDESTVQTKNKMAEVDDMLKNLKDNKERLLRQMQKEQYERQQEQAKAKEQERLTEAERMYHEGLEFLRSHDYAKAKIKFLELDNIYPDYRATRRYLIRTEEDLKRANVEAVTVNEKNESEHLRKLQDTESTAEISRIRKEEEKQQLQEQEQQASLKEFAQKASDLNDDIIRLSKQQDYEAMKAKFAELEKTVTALTALKDEMANQQGRQERSKQLIHEAILRHNEVIKEQEQEDTQIHAYGIENPLKENRPILSNQTSDADYFKQREIMQEQNVLFTEGVGLYEHKKYTQAKLLFGELSDQHDRRAEAWLKKVDHAITQELLKSEEAEARERTAFLEDQLNAQRELVIIQERERQRQKKLTEELERQKRLYEDDRLMQLRKEETMKVQERERQRQEEKRLRSEKENEKKQDMFRFHKIVTVVKPQPVAAVLSVPQPKIVAPPAAPVPAVAAPVASVVVPVKPPALSAKQIQEQARQKLKAQREAERQARLKAQAEARQKREEERQKEKDRQRELRAQREAERQARLKAEAEKLAQEQNRREELLRQQEEKRQEKLKQEEIIREEAQRQQESERQERQRQAQLEAQRESVRKQLEDGVEAMYQDALSLYNQGDYSAAADRFKDVQDIIPGYKSSEQYMDEARQRSLTVKPQAEIVPQAAADQTNTSTPPAVAASATTPVSHQDDVSKALDIFEPDAK